MHPRPSKKSNFRAHFWWAVEIWSVGAVNLVVLACLEGSDSKKSTFSRKRCTPTEHPAYAHVDTWPHLLLSLENVVAAFSFNFCFKKLYFL